jgi:GNAT superfamily N-acetyltransferase
MPDSVPVALLGRLAVDRRWQSSGFGAGLLRDAALRVVGAAKTIGVRALLVHAISDEAKAFYQHWGLRALVTDPMTLMITIEEAKRMLGRPR